MKLIDKDALVAKIKRLYNRAERRVTLEKEGLKAEDTRRYEDGLADAYDIILSLIDTLEEKEVDLEKEISEYFVSHPDEFFSDKYKLIAEYFFELGMQQSKNDNNNEEKK